MTGFTYNSNEYNVNYGSSIIEYANSLGTVGYSMYGSDIPFIPAGEQVEKIQFDSKRMMVLTKSGNLYVCGSNNQGGLGQGDTTYILTYTKAAEGVRDILLSSGNSYYITEDNKLYGSGYNEHNKLTSSSDTHIKEYTLIAQNVKSVYDGNASFNNTASNCYYVDMNDVLYGRGNNSSGQLAANPSNYSKFSNWRNIGTDAKQVCVDGSSTFYVSNNGTLYGCGNNTWYQQGTGDTKYVTYMRTIAYDVKYVKRPYQATLYLKNNGDLYATGYSDYGQAGEPAKNDHYAYSFSRQATGIVDFEVGKYNTMCLTNEGQLICAGKNAKSGLKWPEGSNVKDFKLVEDMFFYRTTNNDLYGKGKNNYGQQGTNSTSWESNFTKKAENVKDYWVYNGASYYIDSNNDLYGAGGKFQLAQNENKLIYTKLAENVKSLAYSDTSRTETYYPSNLAYIDNNNALYMGGSNIYGLLGNGTRDTGSTTTCYPTDKVNIGM